MNTAALFNLSYGLYVIATKEENRNVGCVVNTVAQISSKPVSIAVSTNKDNYTTGAIMKAGKFTVSVMSENTPKTVIGTFGSSSSKDKNKFDEVKYKTLESGLPVITEEICAFLECKVINSIECYTHKIILAEVVDADILTGGKPMTYDYYHKVVKGTTPKNAATYIEKAAEPQSESGYVCSVCGYKYPGTKEEFEALPDDYRCPICKVLKEKFVLS